MNKNTNGKKLDLGIVTTVADAEDSIAHFIEYHQKIGFSRIYIFVDDNSEATQKIAQSYENVFCYMKDATLLARWGHLIASMDDPKWELLNEEVMIRQELNFYVAHQDAKNNNVDWLLHIDLDELFYPNGNDIQTHFADLQIKGFGGITYLNYESISTELESKSIYLSSTYFKINFFRHKHWIFNKEQLNCIKNNSWLNEKFFKYYQNGKSCINLYGNSPRFADVHSIWAEGKRKFAGVKDPVILHFPCARYSDFVKKYHRLGNFSDIWMGHKRAGDYIDETHLQSRDIFNSAEANKIDFYRQNFILSEDQINILLDHKLATKIDYHINLLNDKNIISPKSVTHITPEKPTISCLCVTYGRPQYLKKSIECFLNQTYKHKELVVVCNFQDEDTLNLIKNMNASSIRPVILRETHDLKLGDLRNIAINAATGEYVCTWDDDDWSNIDRLELQINAALRHKKPGSILSQILMLDEKNQTGYLSNQRMWENTVLIQKQFLIANNLSYPSYAFGEDYHFVNALINRNALFPLNEAMLYIYRYSGQNTYHEDHFKTLFSRSYKLSNYHTTIMMNTFQDNISVAEASANVYGDYFSENLNYIPIEDHRA